LFIKNVFSSDRPTPLPAESLLANSMTLLVDANLLPLNPFLKSVWRSGGHSGQYAINMKTP
jgi:hypothetical protein